MQRDLLIVFLATENAWTTQYRGEAPVALWARIKKTMKQADRYASYLEIVQSSGTGKSRMIEELSKTRLVIPVNLRGSSNAGLSLFLSRRRRGLKSFRLSSPRQDSTCISFPGDQPKGGPCQCCSFSKGSLQGGFKTYYRASRAAPRGHGLSRPDRGFIQQLYVRGHEVGIAW
jgi:hypothetical protein